MSNNDHQHSLDMDLMPVPCLLVLSHAEVSPEIYSISAPTRRMRKRQHNKIQPTQWNSLSYYKSALFVSVNASIAQLKLLNQSFHIPSYPLLSLCCLRRLSINSYFNELKKDAPGQLISFKHCTCVTFLDISTLCKTKELYFIFCLADDKKRLEIIIKKITLKKSVGVLYFSPASPQIRDFSTSKLTDNITGKNSNYNISINYSHLIYITISYI